MPSETPEDRPKPEIVTDEDWKQRIKAEDAALDQKLKEEAAVLSGNQHHQESEISSDHFLLGHERDLRTAFSNLVANAIRYTDEGKVAVRCAREIGGLRVTVSDTGIGIADDHLADIFDEFYRVEYNPAARDVGLGLGLTIVDRITRLLGITLSVESKPGVGSSFALLLPN